MRLMQMLVLALVFVSGMTISNAEPVTPDLPDDLGEEERRGIQVYRTAAASVVNVTTTALRRNFFFELLEVPQGAGSGFFWDDVGHIVTNYHVIEGANNFTVTLADQSEWEAELIGVAPEKDLAVLRVAAPREKLIPLARGRSERLLVGQRVLAVNTAIYSPNGASAGIGFAIPIDTVSRLVPQLIRFGRAIEPGVDGLHWLTDRQARQFGLEGVGVGGALRMIVERDGQRRELFVELLRLEGERRR